MPEKRGWHTEKEKVMDRIRHWLCGEPLWDDEIVECVIGKAIERGDITTIQGMEIFHKLKQEHADGKLNNKSY